MQKNRGKQQKGKEIGEIKGTFCAKMGMIKNKNDGERTKEDAIKRWQEYTEGRYKKDLKIGKGE